MALHPDFADLSAVPGEVQTADGENAFHLVNLIAFGGAVDRPTHVPVELGRVGTAGLWESTGADDLLPFWNTNEDGDAYLYIVHGSVRVEFKRPGTDDWLGRYLAHTGDLFRLPMGVAHRTFSGDGRRRITLEILPSNPLWESVGRGPEVEPEPSGSVGSFQFEVEPDAVVVSAGGVTTRCPPDTFARALRALSEHELHLGHNELDGGLIVHDHGARVTLSLPGYSEELDADEVLAVFRGLLTRLQQ